VLLVIYLTKIITECTNLRQRNIPQIAGGFYNVSDVLVLNPSSNTEQQ